MSLRVTASYQPGEKNLAYSIQRLADGLWFDFASVTAASPRGAFTAKPAQPTAPLAEDTLTLASGQTAVIAGSYSVTLAVTDPAVFTDGNYAIRLHDTTIGGPLGRVVATPSWAAMKGGTDQPWYPTTLTFPAGLAVTLS